jgi:hypothetical protein
MQQVQGRLYMTRGTSGYNIKWETWMKVFTTWRVHLPRNGKNEISWWNRYLQPRVVEYVDHVGRTNQAVVVIMNSIIQL